MVRWSTPRRQGGGFVNPPVMPPSQIRTARAPVSRASLCGVEVPGRPRGGVVIEEDDGVLGVDIAGVVTGGDHVEAVGADEPGAELGVPATRAVLVVLGAAGGRPGRAGGWCSRAG